VIGVDFNVPIACGGLGHLGLLVRLEKPPDACETTRDCDEKIW